MQFKALACALVLASTQALADPNPWGPVPGAVVVSPREAVAIVHSSGLMPLSPPVLIAGRYEMRAVDPYGIPVRVSVDANRADIIGVRPFGLGPAFAPPGMDPEFDRPYPPDVPRHAYNDRPLVPPRSIPDHRLQKPNLPANDSRSGIRTGRSSNPDETPHTTPRTASPPSPPPVRKSSPAVAGGNGGSTQPSPTDGPRHGQNSDAEVTRSIEPRPSNPAAGNDHGGTSAFPPVTPLQ